MPQCADSGSEGSRGLAPRRLLLLALAALLAAVFVAQGRAVLQGDGTFYAGSDVPVGADFLVFYTAGRIVASGDGARLYDPERQAQEQRAVLGRARGLAIFPYPAFVAAPYALLARLSLRDAYALATLAMLAASLGVVLILRPVSPIVAARPGLVALAILASQPFNTALLGGQLTPFILLCLAGVYAGLRRERPVTTGLWLALLCCKPQMALVLPLLLVVCGRWRAVAVAAVAGMALAGVGVLVAGAAWPLRFLELATGEFYRANAVAADGIRSISLPGVAAYLGGRDSGWATAAAMVCIAAVAALAGAWRGADPRAARFALQFAAAVVVTLIVSPHALFYDAGLLVLAVVLVADGWAEFGGPRAPWPLVIFGGLFLFGQTWPLADRIGFEPLALAPLLVGALILVAMRRPAAAIRATPAV